MYLSELEAKKYAVQTFRKIPQNDLVQMGVFKSYHEKIRGTKKIVSHEYFQAPSVLSE